MQPVLTNIKIIDLTQYVAGPYCTKLLADYGADVIKIEKSSGGDGARKIGPYYHDEIDIEKSVLFLHLNTNKKGITLNLKTATGVKIFKQLISDADILIENFTPRVMPALGLDYETLTRVNPRLVMCSISNFGQTGPYRDYKASELVLFAMGLHMYHEGEPDRQPLKFPGYKAQYLAGTYAATVALAALFGAKSSGSGQHIDISIMECMMAPPEGAAWLMAEAFSHLGMGRAGHRREGAFPQGIYPCKDGYIFIYGIIPFFWPRIVTWMGMPELLNDSRFATPEARTLHHGDFDAIFIPWTLEHTRDEIFHSAQANRIPATPVYTINELIEDPQFRSRNSFVEIEHPIIGVAKYPNLPFKLPQVPSEFQLPAPSLGQHNIEIYCGRLGYSREDVQKLRERGVI